MDVQEEAPLLKSFSLTHVQYATGDRIGLLLAVVTLVPIAVLVLYGTLLAEGCLLQRQIRPLVAKSLIGQLLNEALNWALKTWIREQRPLHPVNRG